MGFTPDAKQAGKGFTPDAKQPAQSGASTFLDAMGRAIAVPGRPDLNLDALSRAASDKLGLGGVDASMGASPANEAAGAKAHPIAGATGGLAGHVLEGIETGGPVGAAARTALGAGRVASAGAGLLEGAAGGAGGDPEHPGVGAAVGGTLGGAIGGLVGGTSGVVDGGFRTAEGHGVAQSVAGDSGRQALTIFNQKVGNQLAAAEARVPVGTTLSPAALDSARGPANAVYNRFGASLPQNMELPGDLSTHLAALDRAEPQLSGIPGHVTLDGQFNGNTLVNKVRQLRQEASSQMASEGDNAVVQQQIGRAKMDIANRLESFASGQIPPGASVDLQQLSDARTSLAKSYAVEDALKGGHDVDMARLGRASAAQEGLFTGGLKQIADFANNNPTIAGNASKIYQQPGVLNDLIQSGGHAPWSPSAAVLGATGLRPLARGVLTGFGKTPADFAQDLRAAQPSLAPKVPNELPMSPSPGPGPTPPTQTGMPLPQGNGPNPDLKLAPPEGTVSQPPQQTGMPLPQGPGPNPDLQLTQPPGTVFDALQRDMGGLPQGNGPNPDLKLAPPEGSVFDQLQRPLGNAQNPGNWTPPTPGGTAPSQGGLFDQLSLADSGPRPAAFNDLEHSQDLLSNYKPPDDLPKGESFNGTLHRGTPEGIDPNAANEHGFRFMATDPKQAAEYGNVTSHDVQFGNVLNQGSPAANAKALGLPETANQIDIARAARKAGYDAVKTKIGNGTEYADLRGPEPDPVGTQLAGG